MKPLLLRHLDGENMGRFPVWMMRQAGRYLDSYRALREGRTFWDMATDPALASRVSLLPLEVVPVDAIIFFSDILTPPYGMGIPVELKESIGPVVQQDFTQRKHFDVFEQFAAEKHVGFVGETLKLIRKDLDEEIALLGFAGAPWTLGAYLIEGNLKSRQFKTIKEWMYRAPEDLAAALSTLGDATAQYLVYQVKSGAQMVQLFDTWASEMPLWFFVKHYLPIIQSISSTVASQGGRFIYFMKSAHHLMPALVNLQADALSVDSLRSMGEVDSLLKNQFSLQGNLDPILLFSDEKSVRKHTRELVEECRKLARPAILNLGHGILPKTPVENVKAFVEEATKPWS